MQGIYTYVPETNYVPREYGVAAILLFLFMGLISLVSVLNLLYFYISTFRSMCAVPNMAVFCSSLTSWFPGMLLTYFLNDVEIVPVAPIITCITFVFTFHMRLLLLLLLLYENWIRMHWVWLTLSKGGIRCGTWKWNMVHDRGRCVKIEYMREENLKEDVRTGGTAWSVENEKWLETSINIYKLGYCSGYSYTQKIWM